MGRPARPSASSCVPIARGDDHAQHAPVLSAPTATVRVSFLTIANNVGEPDERLRTELRYWIEIDPARR